MASVHSMMIEKPCAGEMGHTIFFSGIRGRDKSIYEMHRRLEHMHVCLSCKETARVLEKSMPITRMHAIQDLDWRQRLDEQLQLITLYLK